MSFSITLIRLENPEFSYFDNARYDCQIERSPRLPDGREICFTKSKPNHTRKSIYAKTQKS